MAEKYKEIHVDFTNMAGKFLFKLTRVFVWCSVYLNSGMFRNFLLENIRK